MATRRNTKNLRVLRGRGRLRTVFTRGTRSSRQPRTVKCIAYPNRDPSRPSSDRRFTERDVGRIACRELSRLDRAKLREELDKCGICDDPSRQRQGGQSAFAAMAALAEQVLTYVVAAAAVIAALALFSRYAGFLTMAALRVVPFIAPLAARRALQVTITNAANDSVFLTQAPATMRSIAQFLRHAANDPLFRRAISQ